MKRILYSCLIVLSLCLNHTLKAQIASYSLAPNAMCYNTTGIYTPSAAIVSSVTGATHYSWTVVTSATTCVASFTPYTQGIFTSTDDAIAMTIPCCGNYTVICLAWQGPTFLSAVSISTFQSGQQQQGVIYCPSGGAGLVQSSQAVCAGNSATLTGSGATSYTWSDGTQNTTGILVVTPLVNTCYTYTGSTAQGCTITPSSAACVSVQAITGTFSPVSQSMCVGSPISMTAAATVLTPTNYAAGTSITGYQWFPPTGPTVTTPTYNTLAPNSNFVYNAIITHTGAAGTCTLAGSSNFVLVTSIPVTLTPANPSVCPGGVISLTAVSVQTTTATNFTWITANSGGTPTTSVLHNNPHNVTVINPAYTVTVNVQYFTCPGTATTTIGLLTLTPTLTSSAPETCPGQSLTLTASGGVTYTFTGLPAPPSPSFALNNGFPSNPTVVHSPSSAQLPIQYCVSAFSTGCTGTTCIVVVTRTLTPTLSASSASVCPGTEFTLTASGSGVHPGATYTFGANFNPNIGTTNPLIYTPVAPNLSMLPPRVYSVTVDSAGCTGVAQVSISLLTITPTLTASSPSVCAGTSLTLISTGGAGTNYTFTASHPQFSTSATATVIDAAGSNTTGHVPPNVPLLSYTVHVDSVGCKGTDTFTVGILDLGPTLTLSTLPAGSVCPGSTVTINASGALSYTFFAPSTGSFATGTAPDGTTVVSSNTNVTAPIPLGGAIFTVQADSSTCVGSKTIAIQEFKLNPNIVLTPSLVCSGQSIAVTATNVGSSSGAPTTYTFLAGAPIPTTILTPPGNTSFSIATNPTVQTIYTVLVDSMGCTGIFPPPTATINIRPDLLLLPSTTNASVCPGLATTLSVVAPTTALSYTYTWSQISGTGQITPPLISQTVVAYPITNSTYSVHALDSLGCVGDTVISVSIDPSISFSIALSPSGSTICPNWSPPQTVSLTATSTVALNNNSIGTINYTWTPASSLTSTLGSNVIASPSVTTIYTVVASNGYGCVAQNTVNVVVGSKPNVTIIPSASGVCVGFTSTLTAFGATSYTWTGTTFTNSIPQQSVSVIGGGNYSVVGSNGGGCRDSANVFISLLPNLIITAVPAPNIYTTCITSNYPKFSKPVHLTASGAGSYVWFPYNPLYMTYSLGPQTDVRPPATTQYTVIGSTAICSGTGVVSVNVIPQFTVNVVPPLPAMCLGDSINLSIVNIGTLAVGPVSAFTYSWTEALNAPPLSLSDYFTPNVTVYPQNTTTYTTEVMDSRQCISFPKLVTVTVLPQPMTSVAIPTINSVATNTVCFVGLNPGAPDVTINLTANNTNTGLQFGVVPTYTWISPYVPTSILSPQNSNVVTVSAPKRILNGSSIAVYTVISGYNGVAGCKRMDTVSIRVVDCRPIRNVKFTTAEKLDTICARSCISFVTLTDTMAGGPQKYEWKFEGGAPNSSTLTNPTVCYNFPSSGKPYSVILQVSNPYPLIDPNGGPGGSALSFGQNLIKVVDIPNVMIVAPGQVQSDTTVRFGQSVNLTGSGAHTYEWSPAYNISSLTKPKVTVNPFKTTQYILTGYNSRSCASSDTINVIVIEDCGEMYVPNAFTPNGDGTNDVLYVRGICLQSLTFMVFDRWGEKVFETADQRVGWDGSYKGGEMNTGVFVYRLEGKTYDGKAFSAKGNITLIR